VIDKVSRLPTAPKYTRSRMSDQAGSEVPRAETVTRQVLADV